MEFQRWSQTVVDSRGLQGALKPSLVGFLCAFTLRTICVLVQGSLRQSTSRQRFPFAIPMKQETIFCALLAVCVLVVGASATPSGFIDCDSDRTICIGRTVSQFGYRYDMMCDRFDVSSGSATPRLSVSSLLVSTLLSCALMPFFHPFLLALLSAGTSRIVGATLLPQARASGPRTSPTFGTMTRASTSR